MKQLKHATPPKRVEFGSKVHLVPMALMRRPSFLQKEFNQDRADRMAADLHLEGLGRLLVNHRDGVFYIIDGCHRHEALMKNGFGEYEIECDVHTGLSDEDMARVFLLHARRRVMSAFETFNVNVEAGHARECEILRTVNACQLKITRTKEQNCLKSVAAIGKVFDVGGPKVLQQSLRLLASGFSGDPAAFDGTMIVGAGGLINRFNGRTKDRELADKLSKLPNGPRWILQRAESIKQKTGNDKAQCVSAVLVDLHNRGLSPKDKLPSWWKSANPETDA